MENLELFEGKLPVEKITNAWYDKYRNSNYGAIITFVGVVRDENKIDGLSFDIYEPILNSWFNSWEEKAKELNSEDYNLYQKWGDNLFFLANLKGEVSIYEESLEKYEKALGINENGYHALIGRKLILFRLARLGKNTESFKRTKEKYEEFIKKYSKSELVRIGDTEFIAAIYELEHNYNHSH